MLTNNSIFFLATLYECVSPLGFEVYRYSKKSRYRTFFFGIIQKTVIGNRYMNTVF